MAPDWIENFISIEEDVSLYRISIFIGDLGGIEDFALCAGFYFEWRVDGVDSLHRAAGVPVVQRLHQGHVRRRGSEIPTIFPICGASASIHVRIAFIFPVWRTPPPKGIRAPCSGPVGPINFVNRKLFSGFPWIHEFHTGGSRCRVQVLWHNVNQIFIGETIGEIHIAGVCRRGMADAVRTTPIEDVFLDVVIRSTFLRGGLSKAATHPNEVQDVNNPVAIDIRIPFRSAIRQLTEGTSRQAPSLGCSRHHRD